MNSLTCTDSKNNNHDFTTKVELDMVKGQAKQDFYRNRTPFIRIMDYKDIFLQFTPLKYSFMSTSKNQFYQLAVMNLVIIILSQ